MPIRNTPLYFPTLSILVAMELLLAFSVFGYIVIPPISLTFMPLPVLVGALLFGPAEGLFLGGIFGLTSMWKASVTATAYADQIFSPFVSGAPLSSLVLSMGTRMAFGFLAGWLFLYAKRIRSHKKTYIVFISLFVNMLHSLLVIAAIHILFPDAGITIIYGISRIFSLNHLLSWGTVSLFVLMIFSVLNSREAHIFRDEIKQTEGIKASPRILLALTIFIIFTFLLTAGLWYHFYNRTELILRHENVIISEKALSQFWQLGSQFLVAVISLFLIVSIVLLLIEKYLLTLAHQARRDMMTGLYNKVTLIRHVDEALRNIRSGFLLILDVDNFKKLNDTYGHPAGDKVLITIAGILQAHFNKYGIVGRLGGDEFCVYADGISETEMLEEANGVCKDVADLSMFGADVVSCSIGAASCKGKHIFAEVYAAADQALYHAKGLGKNRCFFDFAQARS